MTSPRFYLTKGLIDYIVFRRRTVLPNIPEAYEARVPRWIYASLTLFTATSALALFWMTQALRPSFPIAIFGFGVAAVMAAGCAFSLWGVLMGGEVNIRIDEHGVSGRHNSFARKLVSWETISDVVVTTSLHANRMQTRRVHAMDAGGTERLVVTLASNREAEYRRLLDCLRSIMDEDEKPR